MSNSTSKLLILFLLEMVTACLMPDLVPAGTGLTQEQWDVLKKRQRASLEEHGGCPNNEEKEVNCHIPKHEFEAVTGHCVLIDNLPMCYMRIADLKYPQTIPNNAECHGLRIHHRQVIRRSYAFRRRYHNTLHAMVAAKRKALAGFGPAMVDLLGRKLPNIACHYQRVVVREDPGTCVKIGKGSYACESIRSKKLQLLHPLCEYLNKTNT